MSCYIAVDTKQQCQDGRCQTNMVTMEIGMTADQFIRDPLPATESLFESERRGIYYAFTINRSKCIHFHRDFWPMLDLF
jgi:hypothetical protein